MPQGFPPVIWQKNGTNVELSISGTKVVQIQSNGNLRIKGTFEEGATIV